MIDPASITGGACSAMMVVMVRQVLPSPVARVIGYAFSGFLSFCMIEDTGRRMGWTWSISLWLAGVLLGGASCIANQSLVRFLEKKAQRKQSERP